MQHMFTFRSGQICDLRTATSLETNRTTMGIFTRQTTRSFVIGFMLGAFVIATTWGGNEDSNLANRVIPSAIAAKAE